MTIAPRNACPTLADPMRTGDGWLARLPPVTRAMLPVQLAALARAAVAHGNGLVEISKRGNIQVRGLPDPDRAPALAADLNTAGLDLPTGLPITTDPLLDLAGRQNEAMALVAAIHVAIDTAGLGSRLAPKVALVLDFGTAFRPANVSADIRLRIDGAHVHVALGGDDADARPIGAVSRDHGVAACIALLDTLAGFGPTARLSGRPDLKAHQEFDRAIAGFRLDVPAPPAASAPATIGLLAAADGVPTEVLAIAFAFGQATAADLLRLAEMAENVGIIAIAPAPERRLMLAGPVDAVAAIADMAARLGFITRPDDPRRFISACIGSAGCASGNYAARAEAGMIADAAASLFDGSVSLHLSGCPKGCAHPAPATLTLAGIDKGVGLVLQGRARDVPTGFGPPDGLAGRFARLAEAVERLRRPDETVDAILERMGARRIEEAMGLNLEDGSADYGGKPRLFA